VSVGRDYVTTREASVTDEEQSTTEDQETGGDGGGDTQQSDEIAAARKADEETEKAKEKVKELEDDPPEKLEDWPDDKAKYETFGGAEGNEGYEDSVTSKLGPSSLRYREDGSVEIGGEKVDDPEEFKGDPIPGGPTDPKISDSRAYGEPDLTDETSVDVADGEGGSGDEASGDEAPEGEASGEDDKPE
jgi:hypothetical protein